MSKVATAVIEDLPVRVWIEFAEDSAISRQLIMDIEEAETKWVSEVKNYIESGTLPIDREEARAIKNRAARYTVMDEVLYRRSFRKPLLRCVEPSRESAR